MQIKNKKCGNDSAGFTLFEILIAMVISGAIAAAIYTAYLSQQRSYNAQDQVAEMQQNIRVALLLITQDVRMAGYDSTESGNYGITTADNDQFVFTADLSEDGNAPGAGEMFTYELFANGAGKRSMRRGAGEGAVSENIETIEFQYLDASGSDLGDPSGNVPTASLDDIRSVQVTILARASKPDRKFVNNMTYTSASGVPWGPYNDNYRRRLLTKTVNCRNMGL
jgi:type IV pilus assembly protein PilW